MRRCSAHLEHLWHRGQTFLNVPYPILGGAMTWVSDHNLVAAISNAGAFGILASGAMPPEALAAEIKKTQALCKDSAFGVNLITLHPQLDALLAVCIQENVTHVVLAGGLPSAASIQTLKDAHIKVMCFAPALVIAKKLVKLGVGALIIEGMEAGGHIGPVSTSVLAQEILPHITQIPVFVAGGIGHGAAIAMYLQMGASGCQIGTRFVCASESVAHDKFKQAFIHANARDAVATVQVDGRFPIIPVRAITNKATNDFAAKQIEVIKKFNDGALDQKEAQLEIEHFWAGSLRRAVVDGDVETGSLMAGQSVGLVKSVQPAATIIQELILQAEEILGKPRQ